MVAFTLLRDSTTRQILRQSDGRMLGVAPVDPNTGKFPNGFAARFPFAVSRLLVPDALSDFPVYFSLTRPELKSAANGGSVRTGFDFQLEDASGTVLPFVVLEWNASTGYILVVAAKDLVANAGNYGYLYFDNENATVTRENRLDAWGKALVSFNPASRLDFSGNGRHMPTDFLTGAAKIGASSASFNGTDQSRSALAPWLGGSAALSFSAWIKSDVIDVDNAAVAVGVAGGNTPFFIRADAVGTENQKNCWRFGWITASSGITYETEADLVDTNWHHIFVVYRPGQLPLFVRDGVLKALPYQTVADRSDAIISQTGDTLFIGRGSVLTSRFWDGLIDSVKFWPVAKTLAYAQADYRTQNYPGEYVIFGDLEDGVSNARSPINELYKAEVVQAETKRVPTTGYLVTPGSTTLNVETATTTLGTTAKVDNTNVDYKSTGAFGADITKVGHTVGGKKVVSPIWVNVLEGTGGGPGPGPDPVPGGNLPTDDPNIFGEMNKSGLTAITYNSQQAFADAIGSFDTSKNYAKLNFKSTSSMTISRKFPAGAPFIVSADAANLGDFAGRAGLGNVVVTGAYIAFEKQHIGMVSIRGDHVAVLRSLIDQNTAFCVHNSAENGAGHYFHVAYNRMMCKGSSAQSIIELDHNRNQKQPDYGMIACNDAPEYPGGFDYPSEIAFLYSSDGFVKEQGNGHFEEPFWDGQGSANTRACWNWIHHARPYGIYIKNWIAEIDHNHHQPPKSAFHGISCRGCNNRYVNIHDNLVIGAQACNMQGWDTKFENNWLEGGTTLDLYCCSWQEITGKPICGAFGFRGKSCVVSGRINLGQQRTGSGYYVRTPLADVVLENFTKNAAGDAVTVVNDNGGTVNFGADFKPTANANFFDRTNIFKRPTSTREKKRPKELTTAIVGPSAPVNLMPRNKL